MCKLIGLIAAVVGHAVLERLWPPRHVRENQARRDFVGSFDVEQEVLEAGELTVCHDGDRVLLIPNPARAIKTAAWSPFDPETGLIRDNVFTAEGFYPIGTISEDGLR